MARIEHSFSIDQPPEPAQAMFLRDIAPELARDRGFQIAHESPGRLLFSDGKRVPSGDEDLLAEEYAEPAAGEEKIVAPDSGPLLGPTGSLAGGGRLTEKPLFEDADKMLSRHIRVEFTAQGTGTLVSIRGHAERDIAHALELLGTARHWPETADLPHD
jgi:hypothetical protein